MEFTKNRNPYDHLNRCDKTMTKFPYMKTQQTRIRRKLPQPDKVYLQEL